MNLFILKIRLCNLIEALNANMIYMKVTLWMLEKLLRQKSNICFNNRKLVEPTNIQNPIFEIKSDLMWLANESFIFEESSKKFLEPNQGTERVYDFLRSVWTSQNVNPWKSLNLLHTENSELFLHIHTLNKNWEVSSEWFSSMI